ncbi:hypothetical protein M5K25_024171 [Dendrobium thyrsiflorum]|uniref:Uncharacterized protein n=1 Tax=Dendrobium thyrsiflorum TaxID=117978 RepID=A0ABD0U1L4_DENTH
MRASYRTREKRRELDIAAEGWGAEYAESGQDLRQRPLCCLDDYNPTQFSKVVHMKADQVPVVTVWTTAVPVYDMTTKEPAERPYFTEAVARRTHLPAQRVPLAKATIAEKVPQKRISTFERLSQSEIPARKRVVTGKQFFVVLANTTALPTRLFTSGKNDVEAFTSIGKPSRRRRRKMNAELRVQQLLPIHPYTLSA